MIAWGLIAGVAALAAAPNGAPQRVDLQNGYYLLDRPASARPDAPLPLIVCLHGTDDTAADMLAFWRSLSANLAYVMVAPQGSRAGWRDADLPLLREMAAHVARNVVYDPGRVLLTGHSAGGPMAFRLLYLEHFPATAVAVTANYVPPDLTPEQVKGRADVPVFYAVGVSDVNQERMRAGVALLRSAGVRITMRRPHIGHLLSREVGQEALDWYEQLCRSRVQARVEEARGYQSADGPVGPLVAELEGSVRYPEGAFADQAPAVREALARLETPARQMFAQAQDFAAARQYAAAYALYGRVERECLPATLGQAAREARLNLERDPAAAAAIGNAGSPTTQLDRR